MRRGGRGHSSALRNHSKHSAQPCGLYRGLGPPNRTALMAADSTTLCGLYWRREPCHTVWTLPGRKRPHRADFSEGTPRLGREYLKLKLDHTVWTLPGNQRPNWADFSQLTPLRGGNFPRGRPRHAMWTLPGS